MAHAGISLQNRLKKHHMLFFRDLNERLNDRARNGRNTCTNNCNAYTPPAHKRPLYTKTFRYDLSSYRFILSAPRAASLQSSAAHPEH